MGEKEFKTITTKLDMLVDKKILLLAEVVELTLQMFVTQMNKLDGKTIRGLNNGYCDMHLCLTANAFSLSLYTDRIFNDYKMRLKARELTYNQLISIIKARKQNRNKYRHGRYYACSQYPTQEQKVPGGLRYVQDLGRIGRKTLVSGDKIRFVDYLGKVIVSGKQVLEIPVVLFKAVSAKHNLVVEGKIVVPKSINIDAVKRVVTLVLELPVSKRVYQFQKHTVKDVQGQPIKGVEDPFKDLHLCCAAEAFGMGSFTQDIFNSLFSRVNTIVPPKVIIDMITATHNPTGDKLFKQMSHTIAKKLYEDTFTTGDKFEQYYLPTNPRLSEAIHHFIAKFEERAIRDAAYQERVAKRMVLAAKEEERQRRNKEYNALKAAEEKMNAEKAAELSAAGESYRQKLREGKKNFTPLEASYAWKVTGKRVAATGSN
ncbi:hypothetical protein G6011_09398 [Alternaria panax]|uniref:Uncharacterized protein n=1 Tax=Alternaria panax TaxID=48097 RepID=A0AAD4IB66_9PLEO|nr:hypothetical protein G6011_09398 [Alternaria panax]